MCWPVLHVGYVLASASCRLEFTAHRHETFVINLMTLFHLSLSIFWIEKKTALELDPEKNYITKLAMQLYGPLLSFARQMATFMQPLFANVDPFTDCGRAPVTSISRC